MRSLGSMGQGMQLRRDMTWIAVVVLALGAIVGAELGGDWWWLHYLCKPLTMVAIISTVAQAGAAAARYRTLVLVGMLCSLAGDVFLMLPQDLFVPGLLAFLVAHLFYIAAFFPGATPRGRLLAILGYVIVAAGSVTLLLPKVPAALQIPVVAYGFVLVVMAGLAAARASTMRRDPALAAPTRMAALGAFLFVISDNVLAWDRFGHDVPVAMLLILATYFGAQWCIARSVVLLGKHR